MKLDEEPSIKISLLYATYFKPGGPIGHADEWLAKAADPNNVEICFGVTGSDSLAIQQTQTAQRHIVSPESSGSRPTSTRAWNGAASKSTGDLLFVIADDLSAPERWDESLRVFAAQILSDFPECAIKVSDGPDKRDTFMRHPIVSRKFFERFGLFDEDFYHLYCDADLSLRSFWHSVIFDARHIQFSHEHPLANKNTPLTHSQLVGNARIEREKGYRTLKRKWGFAMRVLEVDVCNVTRFTPLMSATQIRLLLLLRMTSKLGVNISRVARIELRGTRRSYKRVIRRGTRALNKAWSFLRRRRILVLHLPKTGGRSLNSALKRSSYMERISWAGHTRYSDIRWRQFYSARVGLIRHPEDWYSSKLRFIRREALENESLQPGFPLDPTIPIIRAGYSDLDSFIGVFGGQISVDRDLLSLPAIEWSRATGYGLYTFFILYFFSEKDVFDLNTNEKTNASLEKIGGTFRFIRTEYMAADAAEILQVKSLDIGHLGKSPNGTHEDKVSPAMAETIWQLDGQAAYLLGRYSLN